jgi:hypothetical protein
LATSSGGVLATDWEASRTRARLIPLAADAIVPAAPAARRNDLRLHFVDFIKNLLHLSSVHFGDQIISKPKTKASDWFLRLISGISDISVIFPQNHTPAILAFQAQDGAGVIPNVIHFETPVIPAKAGIQSVDSAFPKAWAMDSRFRGNGDLHRAVSQMTPAPSGCRSCVLTCPWRRPKMPVKGGPVA